MADRELPRGTVTFLFTDVEGSTRLIDDLGEEDYVEALTEHRRLLRSAFSVFGGVEVDTQGDAFLYAFTDPGAALAAAARAQEALAGGPVKVRMGVHTGEAHLTGEGYAGRELHRAARIAASGHGGQVVVSAATRVLVKVDLTELGEHRVKDFEEPVALFQLGREDFPPLKTISNTNLPRPVSSFVGRAREREELLALLGGGSRLVTLSGPGGSGKTRLALEVAAELVPAFKAGVFWIGLAALRDPVLVPEAIAQTLGAKEGLAEHIGERELLLLLDNFEQVVEAALELSGLLEACPNLRLLVTSRELLRIRGEVDYPVLPLVAPEAVELFCERARLAPDEAIAELCRRLDDMPLALELAAARTRVLAPAQILDRLAQRLDLLKGGRDAEARQQTLRATIQWSHELLNGDEQRLFARLAVFAGGCTLEAAEALADADLDLLQSLVEKSLLRQTEGRFWMLETTREFALERLLEAAPDLPNRHARYFLELAAGVEPELSGERQAEWLRALDDEAPNLRAALAQFADSRCWQEALRLASALRFFWVKRGYLSEGRRWLESLLAADDEPTPPRANALAAAALLANLQGDFGAASRWGEEGRTLALQLGEHRAATGAMLNLGRAMLVLGDRARGAALFEEAGALARVSDEPEAVGMAAFNLGYLALEDCDLERARAEFETATSLRDPYLMARAQAALGSVALHSRDAVAARQHLRESLQIASRLDAYEDTATWALELYAAAISDSDPHGAARLLAAAERMREELGIEQHGIELQLHQRTTLTVRGLLAEDLFEAAWAAGRALSRADAVEEALA
ncbi:MAG TPA: adenylate/guanylate cyclase domain-containing protein [Gaiellaceae bacterium]|jgi:predicted ATPase